MPMYSLIRNSSNYSETRASLWFYSKDEVTNFKVDIANTNQFKSFMYKPKLLENAEADEANRILKNVTIAVPGRYLSNFWRSLKISLINCQAKVKI